MYRILETEIFLEWIAKLRDRTAQTIISRRIRRMTGGNFGDAKSVGQGVSELRIDYGPGYRVYFIQDGDALIVLLCGGDKSSQKRDIASAKEIAKVVKEQK